MSSWAGGVLLRFGEWIITQLPLVKNIYSASKQVIKSFKICKDCVLGECSAQS